MRIYLIGMPGSGKTTVAALLAKKLHMKHVDLDGLIEKQALMFVDDIFDNYGEETFRRLETQALTSIKDDHIIISCGGGVVLRKENKKLMDGLTIYLDTDMDLIKERLKTDYQRPLLRKKTLDALYDERFLKYQDFADKIVSNNYDIQTTVSVIVNYLEQGGII